MSDGPLAYYRFSDGVSTETFDIAANQGSLGASGNGAYSTTIVRRVAGALVGSANTAGAVKAKIGKIHVNGTLKGTSTNAPTYAPDAASNYTFGSRSDNAFAWAGSIDEPAYYDHALEDTQVAAHYNNGIDTHPGDFLQYPGQRRLACRLLAIR